MDEEHPDAGMVLAHVYAAMMENTVSKYNRIMYNHFLSFLNLLGTRLLPPAPAEGMVTVKCSRRGERSICPRAQWCMPPPTPMPAGSFTRLLRA